MNELKLLAYSCISILSILINQYKQGEISYVELRSNSKLKIDFLKNHIKHLNDAQMKISAENIILQYSTLMISPFDFPQHQKFHF